jgi:DNA processing protein
MYEHIDEPEWACLWHLWTIRGVRHGHLRSLTENLDVRTLWNEGDADVKQHAERAGFSDELAESVIQRIRNHPEPERAYQRERERLPDDARLLPAGGDDYPARLLDLEEPPTFVYVRGDLEVCSADHTLSVVGSRDVTVEDARYARGMVSDVASAGVRIVSGGAFGVDRAAHEAALGTDTPTLVVLPGGLDEPAPRSNSDVFRRVVECGALVTEYPLGVDVRPYHFPRRNRLIAALGDATFIVRAGPDSGTMLTAEATRKVGRPLCVLPGDPRDALTEGCLELLVEGEQAVRDADDVLETYFPRLLEEQTGEADDSTEEVSDADRRARKLDEVSDEARRIAEEILGSDLELDEPLGIDELGRVTDAEPSEIQSALLELELYGICSKAPGSNSYEFR